MGPIGSKVIEVKGHFFCYRGQRSNFCISAVVVSRVCEFVCQSELSYFVPGVRVRQLSKLSFRVVVILVSFFARAKVVKVTNSFLKLFSGLKSFVYPPRCKYCNSVVFHPLLYAIDISFLQNLRYFSMFF